MSFLRDLLRLTDSHRDNAAPAKPDMEFYFKKRIDEVKADNDRHLSRLSLVFGAQVGIVALVALIITILSIADRYAAREAIQGMQERFESLTKDMTAVHQRFLVVARISDAAAKARNYDRHGLDELQAIIDSDADPEEKALAADMYKRISEDTESAMLRAMAQAKKEAVAYLTTWLSPTGKKLDFNEPRNLIEVINGEDLWLTATAFIALREVTGKDFEMFDFEAVERWAQQHPDGASK